MSNPIPGPAGFADALRDGAIVILNDALLHRGDLTVDPISFDRAALEAELDALIMEESLTISTLFVDEALSMISNFGRDGFDREAFVAEVMAEDWDAVLEGLRTDVAIMEGAAVRVVEKMRLRRRLATTTGVVVRGVLGAALPLLIAS